MSPERSPLTYALLLSLLTHTLLLSLTFDGQGLWLPGVRFPWQDRRIEVTDLRVVVVPAQVTAAEPAVAPVAEPLQQAWVEQPVASRPTPASGAPTERRTATAIVPEADLRAEANPRTDAATGAAPAKMPLRADRPGDTAPAPAVIALARTDEATWFVPATPAMPAPVIAAAPSASSPETTMPSLRDPGDGSGERAVELAKLDPSKQEGQRQAEQLEAARQDAARQELARAENARLEAERQQTARQAADLQKAAREVVARHEAALLEAAGLEAERQETAPQATDLQEAAREVVARQEAAVLEAARVEAARVEAARVEAARVEAARVEAARVEAARVEAARVEVAQEAAARREAALRAIGRQLDEEADRREASSGARRYWLFGRTDPNAEVILYAEAWSRKIQLNVTMFDMVRETAKQPHTDPVVTVAIRSDGSVESVTFVLSSGVAAIDEAIRRIVDSQKPYQVFPPGLAREYDVILIRRSWHFDTAIRLQ